MTPDHSKDGCNWDGEAVFLDHFLQRKGETVWYLQSFDGTGKGLSIFWRQQVNHKCHSHCWGPVPSIRHHPLGLEKPSHGHFPLKMGIQNVVSELIEGEVSQSCSPVQADTRTCDSSHSSISIKIRAGRKEAHHGSNTVWIRSSLSPV